MWSLRAAGITRDFQWLIRDVDCDIEAGQCWHLKGPNGVGKTTLLRSIVGLRSLDAGTQHWKNAPIKSSDETAQSEWLYLGHQLGVTPSLSVTENLQHFARLQGVEKTTQSSRVATALEAIGLTDKSDALAKDLSAGQKRRVGLARLWLSEQTFWLLDEPLTALDVASVEVIEQQISHHCQQGGLVLMTSHQALNCATHTLNLDQFVPAKRDALVLQELDGL